jgi:hypothetical protein
MLGKKRYTQVRSDFLGSYTFANMSFCFASKKNALLWTASESPVCRSVKHLSMTKICPLGLLPVTMIPGRTSPTIHSFCQESSSGGLHQRCDAEVGTAMSDSGCDSVRCQLPSGESPFGCRLQSYNPCISVTQFEATCSK